MTVVVSPQNYSLILQIFLAIVSILCSWVTILVIYKMKRFNGLLLLIANLAFSQSMYDLSILMQVGTGNVVVAYYALRTFFGLTTTFLTNVISFIVLYLVFWIKVFDVTKLLYKLLLIIAIPSLIITIIDVDATVNYGAPTDVNLFNGITSTYFWLRIASICVNVVIYGVMSIKLINRRDNTGETSTLDNDPIKALAYRMLFYPVVQIITRFGAAWYELAYGFNTDWNPSYSTLQQASLMVYSLTLPSAGIGFFIVFFLVTPGSRPVFYRLLTGKWSNAADDEDSGIKVYDASDIERLSIQSSNNGIAGSSGAQNPFQMGFDATPAPVGVSSRTASNYSESRSTAALRSFQQVDDNGLWMIINNSNKANGIASDSTNSVFNPWIQQPQPMSPVVGLEFNSITQPGTGGQATARPQPR